MKHRLLGILSTIPMLLFVGVVVLWVRSYFVLDRFVEGGLPDKAERVRRVVSSGGRVRVVDAYGVSQGENRAAANWEQDWLRLSTGDRGPLAPTQPVEGVFVRERWVSVPYWVPAGVLGLMTAPATTAVMRRLRRDRREKAGRCRACGYDLRATPGQCPECGERMVPASVNGPGQGKTTGSEGADRVVNRATM